MMDFEKRISWNFTHFSYLIKNFYCLFYAWKLKMYFETCDFLKPDKLEVFSSL